MNQGRGGGGGGEPIPSLPGPASGPLSLAARPAGGPPRPNLGSMAMPASAPGRTGVAARRMGPPGGLSLSGMSGAPQEDGNKFSDFGKIM